jgi:DNA-binding FadR family transcriptional regulator
VAELLSQSAAERLRLQILDGTYPPGSQLPSERELSEQLGLSRTALRDALQTLQATGFVEVHMGRGRYVADPTGRGAAAARSWLAIHRLDLESLNDVRRLLEPHAVETMNKDLVTSIATRAGAIVGRQLEAVAGGSLHVAADLDGDFHSILVSGTPNGPLRELTEQLIGMARAHAVRVYSVPGVAAHSVAQHDDIVKAVERGDLDRAAELVRDHAVSAYRLAFDD